MTIVNKLNVYLDDDRRRAHVDAVQYDINTRRLEMLLFSGGTAWSIPSGVTASVAYHKPDGTSGWYDKLPDGTAACSYNSNVVTAILAEQVLTAVGEVKLSVVLQNTATGAQIASFPVIIDVRPHPAAGQKKPSNNYYNYKTMGQVNAALAALEARAETFPAYRKADPAEYGGLTSHLVDDGFYLTNTDDWADLPGDVGNAALLVFRYAPNYVMQVAVSQTNGVQQTRIVNRNDYTVFRDWMPAVSDYRTADPETYGRLTSHLVEGGFYTITASEWDDFPVNRGGSLLVFRHSPNYVTQIAVSYLTGEVMTRIVNRKDFSVYRDWRASDGSKCPRILVVGDSIAYGWRNGYKGFVGDLGVPYRIDAKPGATLSSANAEVVDIPNQLAAVEGYAPDAVIANGGVNDYAYKAPMGDIPTAAITTAADAEALDRSTVMGGLQCLLYRMEEKYPDAKHYFLLTHKTLNWPTTANNAGYTQTELFDAIKAVCGLYGVEIIDVFDESCINTAQSVYVSQVKYADDNSVTDSQWVDADGVHPLAYGYLHGYVPIVRRVLGLGGDDSVDPKVIEEIIRGSMYPLTINGTTYDGSEAVNIEISGGSGEAPYIGSNGNWWIGEDDTGVKASGEDGRSVYSVELDASQSDEGKSVYSMTDDGDRTIGSFTVYHGKDGGQGPQGPQGEKGDAYVLTDADKAEIAEQVEGATIVQPPKYVETVEEMTDTDRPYVLASTGRIYAYMDETYEQEVTVTDQIEATDDNPYLDGNRLGGSGDSFSADAAGYHVTPLIDLTKAEYVGKTIQLHLEGAHYCSTGSLETWIQCRLYGTDKAVLATRPYTCDAAVDGAYVEYITDGIEISYNSETSATITITVLPTYGSASVKIGYIRFCGKGAVADSNIYITYQDTQTVTGGHWVDTGTTYAPALTDEEKQEIVDQVIERIDTELLSVIGSGEVV